MYARQLCELVHDNLVVLPVLVDELGLLSRQGRETGFEHIFRHAVDLEVSYPDVFQHGHLFLVGFEDR